MSRLINQVGARSGIISGPGLTINTSGNATFTTSPTITGGNLIMGSAGAGIDFSNQASPAAGMTSELFDSYEEGTYTPYFQVSGSNITGGAYDSQIGSYTKIGNVAHVFIYILLNADDISSGAMQVSLPFTQLGYPASASVGYSSGFSNADAPNAGYAAPGTAYIDLVRGGSSDGRSMLNGVVGGDVLTSTGEVRISITLKVS